MSDIDKRPHLTVAAVVERDDHFLLVEEIADGARVYNQPAGHMEGGESIVEACIRETLEETGWHFRPHHVVGVYRWQRPGSDLSFLRFALAGEVFGHEAERPLDEGILRSVWLSREQMLAPEIALRSPMVMRCVDDYLAGHHYPLDLLREVIDV